MKDHMLYRKDIDGLRAIAVIPVLLFHAGFPFILGGYLGVDIFFVISGYLITNILMTDMSLNRFQFFEFYSRRANRLLPALFLVLTVTSFLAFITLPDENFLKYIYSQLSVLAFISNMFFVIVGDYFSPVTEQYYLLHTWSLSVEEQFYFFYPILLGYLVCAKYPVRILVGFLLLSLVLMTVLVFNGFSNVAFYSLPSRAWELAIGALVSVYHFNGRKKYSSALSLVSFATIVFCMFSPVEKENITIGWANVLVCFAAAGIIAYTGRDTITYKILSSRPLVFVGLISYPLYLWHQPLLAMSDYKLLPEWTKLVVLVLSFILAFLTWKFIEFPWRNINFSGRIKIYLLISIWFVIGLGSSVLIIGAKYNGFDRFNYEIDLASVQSSPLRNKCHAASSRLDIVGNECEYNLGKVSWAVFGDSHGVELAYSLAKRIEVVGQALKHYTFSGCPPALDFNTSVSGCSEWIRNSLISIVNNSEIEYVLLAFRHTSFLYGDQLQYGTLTPNHVPTIYNKSWDVLDEKEARDLYWDSFGMIVSALRKSGKKVVLLGPVPELSGDIMQLATPLTIFHQDGLRDLLHVTTVDNFDKRNMEVVRRLKYLIDEEQVLYLDARDAICGDDYCGAVIERKALYFDDDHLSLTGADVILDKFFSKYNGLL
ncbi:acyltransferase family protein [Thalassolituus oleivorans]|uniref:acyltransferase family protein n=1 Tax=Thalassolituus oleivorans TaxID=187493 RepID=UPI002409F1B2|nr:acyltransferase family protein [Thalassolituus oleivorans]MDF1641261.1 acyltransferase family protein [Thalassolituus oleivorans]